MKRLLSQETIIGVFGALAITMLLLGYSFLKGNSIFQRSFVLNARYDHVDGLTPSSPVLYKGFQVGRVKDMQLDAATGTITVRITLSQPLQIPVDSKAELSTSLLGSSSIQLVYGKAAAKVQEGGMVQGTNEIGLGQSLQDQILPVKAKAEKLLVSLDSLASGVNVIVRNGELQSGIDKLNHTLASFEHTAASLDGLVGSEQNRIRAILANVASITANLEKNNATITRAMNNVALISDTLARADISGVIASTKNVLAETQGLLHGIQQGKGTLGQLANNQTLYDNLTSATKDLDELVKAFKDQPSKYLRVKVSLFGK